MNLSLEVQRHLRIVSYVILQQGWPNYGLLTSLIRPTKYLAHFFKHHISDCGRKCPTVDGHISDCGRKFGNVHHISDCGQQRNSIGCCLSRKSH